MSIKYDIHLMKNHCGTGRTKLFVNILHEDPIDDRQLEAKMENSASITASDVRGVLTELSAQAVSELSSGHRFHIPGIGYLSLQASTKCKSIPDVKGYQIYLRNLKFRPEEQLLNAVRSRVTFERSVYTTASKPTTDSEVREFVLDYIRKHTYITTALLSSNMHLSRYLSRKYLTALTDSGVLEQRGNYNSPLWVIKE